jgi:Tfp pilus assembly protein PilF
LLLIADAQLAQHDSVQALVHFYGALDLDPSIVEAWIQIAMIYDSQGKSDSSDQAYERVLQIDPRNMFACNNYAYALAIRGKDLERARDLSWTAVQQNPQNAAYLDTYAWVLFQLGELDRALKYIEKAIELGGNATHYEHLGDILERSGDLDGAVRAWTTALEKDAERTYLRSKIDQYR